MITEAKLQKKQDKSKSDTDDKSKDENMAEFEALRKKYKPDETIDNSSCQIKIKYGKNFILFILFGILVHYFFNYV